MKWGPHVKLSEGAWLSTSLRIGRESPREAGWRRWLLIWAWKWGDFRCTEMGRPQSRKTVERAEKISFWLSAKGTRATPGRADRARTQTFFWSQQRAMKDFSREVIGSEVASGQEAGADGLDRERAEMWCLSHRSVLTHSGKDLRFRCNC